MTRKERAELNRLAAALGYQPAQTTRGGHLAFRHRTTGATVYASATPSDPRSTRNTIGYLRRCARKATA